MLEAYASVWARRPHLRLGSFLHTQFPRMTPCSFNYFWSYNFTFPPSNLWTLQSLPISELPISHNSWDATICTLDKVIDSFCMTRHLRKRLLNFWCYQLSQSCSLMPQHIYWVANHFNIVQLPGVIHYFLLFFSTIQTWKKYLKSGNFQKTDFSGY